LSPAGRSGSPARHSGVTAVAAVAVFSLLTASEVLAGDLSSVGGPDGSVAEPSQSLAERNGNIWSGKAHQPRRANVESEEESADETTPRREENFNEKIDAIERRLKQLEQRYPPGFLRQPEK
jgi:hypothetical protein